MKFRSYYIETWGCQMNVLDGQRIEGLLAAQGMIMAPCAEEADVALLNTCSVRERAVQKVVSRLGDLIASRRRVGSPRVIGLSGCVAEQDGAGLLGRHRGLDFVLGTGKVSMLPQALDAAAAGLRQSYVGFDPTHDYQPDLIARGSAARQYVTVVHGCNQHCTYCVVPYTRGHEISRPLDDIVAEVRGLASRGVAEVTLLGQTVNAYRCPESGAGFAALLAAVCAVAGLWQVAFVTSHPRFFDAELIRTIGCEPRLSSYLHIPFQSGSDTVLRRMRRGYTRESFLDLVSAIRAAAPDVTLSTDVIVGFPGESPEDFEQTLEVVRAVGFGQLFGFIYSARPRTPAARYGDRVARGEAGSRLERVFAVQDAIQLSLNRRLIGRSIEVLVDGPARRGAATWQGRGRDNRVVNFPAWPGVAAGQLATMTITGATSHALLGERSRDEGA